MQVLTRWILATVMAVLVLASAEVNRRHAVAQDSLPEVARALLEFENNVTWESVSPAWRGKRDT